MNTEPSAPPYEVPLTTEETPSFKEINDREIIKYYNKKLKLKENKDKIKSLETISKIQNQQFLDKVDGEVKKIENRIGNCIALTGNCDNINFEIKMYWERPIYINAEHIIRKKYSDYNIICSYRKGWYKIMVFKMIKKKLSKL